MGRTAATGRTALVPVDDRRQTVREYAPHRAGLTHGGPHGPRRTGASRSSECVPHACMRAACTRQRRRGVQRAAAYGADRHAAAPVRVALERVCGPHRQPRVDGHVRALREHKHEQQRADVHVAARACQLQAIPYAVPLCERRTVAKVSAKTRRSACCATQCRTLPRPSLHDAAALCCARPYNTSHATWHCRNRQRRTCIRRRTEAGTEHCSGR